MLACILHNMLVVTMQEYNDSSEPCNTKSACFANNCTIFRQAKKYWTLPVVWDY